MRPLGYVVYFGGPEENADETSGPSLKIYRERSDIFALKEEANCFFPDVTESLHPRLAETMSKLWYRNNTGIDQTVYGGISIGSSLEGSIEIAFATCLRYYDAMYFWKDRVSELVVSESEGELFKIVAAEFGSFISYRPAESNEKSLLAHFEQRNVSKIRLPSSEPLYRLAHRLMRILSLTIRSRKESGQETVLVIGDWTNKKRIDSSQKNYKYTNRWSLKGGAFMVRSLARRRIYLKNLPSQINDEQIRVNLETRLDAMNISNAGQIASILTKVTNHLYLSSRYALADMCAVTSELIDFYQTSELELTSDRYEPFAVAVQIAATKGMRVRIVADGHDSAGLSSPRLRNSDNTSFLVDEFCIAGYGCARRILRQSSLSDVIKVIDSPMLSIYEELMDKPHDIKFSVIIMTWIPRNDRVAGLPDSPFETLFRALEIALEKFSGCIGIKIKHELERPYVELCVQQLNAMGRVKILTGYFYEHIFDTGLVIGGISTAVAECMIVRVPYIVFEPYNNGYDDEDIFGVLSPFGRDLVARNEQQLRKLVEEPTSSVIITREEMLYSKVY